MNLAAKMTAAYFESQGIKCRIMGDEGEAITCGFKGKSKASHDILLVFGEDNTDVAVRYQDYCRIPEEKVNAFYKICSELNQKYRWMKFYVNEKRGTIAIEDDGVIQLDSCGAECLELMIRMCQIADEAYPMVMKALWG